MIQISHQERNREAMKSTDLCKQSRLHLWTGYLCGVLNGISMRCDVPQEVRILCKGIVEKYEKEINLTEGGRG